MHQHAGSDHLRGQPPVCRGPDAAERGQLAVVAHRADRQGVLRGAVVGEGVDVVVALHRHVELPLRPHDAVELAHLYVSAVEAPAAGGQAHVDDQRLDGRRGGAPSAARGTGEVVHAAHYAFRRASALRRREPWPCGCAARPAPCRRSAHPGSRCPPGCRSRACRGRFRRATDRPRPPRYLRSAGSSRRRRWRGSRRCPGG